MILPCRAARPAMVAGALALFALAPAGCAKKITSVDPGFVSPEGVTSNQTLITMWRETPTYIQILKRGNPNTNPPSPDTLADSVAFGAELPRRVHCVILDSTTASAYQVYRRESNGGYLELFDFIAAPTRRWLDRGWESYHFTDNDTVLPSRTYRGRGVAGGVVTTLAPLTKEIRDSVRVVRDINYTAEDGIAPDGEAVPIDSLFLMQWDAVPGAAGYVVHVYQPSFNLLTNDEQAKSGMPAPLFVGKSVDILLAYLPAPSPPTPSMSLTMPTPGARPPGARIMTVRGTRYGQEYRVRVAALDARGQLLAYTYGSRSQQITGLIPGGRTLPTGQFAVYRLGAIRVIPSRPVAGPARATAPRTESPPR